MDQDKNAAATFSLTQSGSISGTTRNAVDATPVPFAIVELRVGEADTTSTPLARTQSGADGSYGFSELPSGIYTAVARANGFITGVASEILVSGEEVSNRDIILSPVLLEGETRIVLTWGDSPEDLDAHLTGGVDEFPFHVYWRTRGSLTNFPFAFLDVDARHGQGPETITITRQSGISRFLVHDFSNLLLQSSSALGASGAKVQVLQGSRLIAQFNVPEQGGTLWTVFELNGPIITPVNTMTYAESVQNVVGGNGEIAAESPVRPVVRKSK
jgi:hypothetical protein